MRIKTAILLSQICPLPTLQTSPLPLPPVFQSTWTLPSLSQLGQQLRPQWSTARSPSPSLLPLQPSLRNSVSSSYLPDQCMLLSKAIETLGERNSSSSHTDWLKLHARIKRSATTIKNNSKSSNSEATTWQSVR